MASPQSEAVTNLYATFSETFAENPDWSPAQQTALWEG